MSQCDLILSRLREAHGQPVPMPELCHVSGSLNCHSRIADLRRRGYSIEYISERRGVTNLSWYRLVEVGGGTDASTGSQPQPCNHVWHTSTDGKARRCIVCNRLEDSERAPTPTAAAAPTSFPVSAVVGAPRDLGLVFVTDKGGIPD